MLGVGWCVVSALSFIQSGVAILLLPLLSFVFFFVGLLGLLRLRWFLLHCVFLRAYGLLLLRFLCSGSGGLDYHSFLHPLFFLAYFVLSPLFSSEPLLRLPFPPSDPLLLLCVLRLPSFARGSVCRFLALPTFLSHPSQVSSFLRFVTWAAVSLSQFPPLSALLTVLRYF